MSEPTPVQNAVQAQKVAAITIAEYDRMAAAYRRGTADHDVSQNIAALLEAIEGAAPHIILDLGCGPGRDLRRFTALGHEAVGLDGSAELAAMARAKTDCEVLLQDFLALDLPSARFDGIFANASLFHVPSSQLARVLGDLAATLKPSGVLFCSNPRGDNEEGWAGGRYGCFHDLETWRAYVTAAGFLELHHYYRPPRRPRAQQPWLATVWRKSFGESCPIAARHADDNRRDSHHPCCRRVCRHAKVDALPAFVVQNDEDHEKPERGGRQDEEIDRSKSLRMVVRCRVVVRNGRRRDG